jgi:hypothetical protein
MTASVLGGGPWRGLGMPLYCLAAVAVGSLSMGHEYTHRTLGLLLSQPVRRRRLLFDKFLATASVLLALLAAAGVFVLAVGGTGTFNHHPGEWSAALVLPLLCGFFLAPWLTMVSRSAIGGIVFTIALPGLLFAAGEIIGTYRFGPGDAADAFIMSILWPGTLLLCVFGAVASWLTFMRLEAADGRWPEVRLPRWLASHLGEMGALVVSKRSRAGLLVAKELRLQQMTLTVACLYVLAWAIARVAGRIDPSLRDLFSVATVLYSCLIALLAGSLASAEERQMRTLEPQLLLPVAVSLQWMIKAGVALTLAIGLGFALPVVLGRALLLIPGAPLVHVTLLAAVLVLTVAGLYVSSLATSGLSAALVSVPAVAVFFVVLRVSGEWTAMLLSRMPRAGAPVGMVLGSRSVPVAGLAIVIAALLGALVLRFGLANHRSSDRSLQRVCLQCVCIAGTAAAGVALLIAVAIHEVPAFPGRP